MMLGRHMAIAAVVLGGFAMIGAGLVGLTYDTTKARIAANERAFLLRTLHELIPADSHDNDMFSDTVDVTSKTLLGSASPLPVYRARAGGWPVAAVMTSIAPDGYSGAIKLLVAVNYDGEVAGVRVLAHKETPGLGDGIDADRSDWIRGFAGRSLGSPQAQGWAVKKDGGVFDQFTGATITPRAVVKAIHRTLKYFDQHKAEIFATPSEELAHGG